MRRCDCLRELRRAWQRLHRDDGQIVLAALLGFIPLMILVVSVLNTGVVTLNRVRLQNASDAAALSAVALEARAMNLISVGNVATTYLLAEAISEEAFLKALDESIEIADYALGVLETACFVGSIFGASAACELIPLYEAEKNYLSNLRSVAQPLLPGLCAFPGERGMPTGGLLFNLMRAIEAMNTAAAHVPLVANERANSIAVENGARGAVIAPFQFTLPVKLGDFRDFGDPTRYGSKSPDKGISPSFQRGYTPILGLAWNHGPLSSAMEKYRYIMYPAVLVGGPWVYDGCVDDVYRDWMGEPRAHRERGEPIFRYEQARRDGPRIGMTSYLNLTLVTVPVESATPPDLDELIGDETRFAGVGAHSRGQFDRYAIDGASAQVDQEQSGASRAVIHEGWYDPERDSELHNLRRVRSGIWQVGGAQTEPVEVEGKTLYRHTIQAVAFQMAYKGGDTDLWTPEGEPEERLPLPSSISTSLPKPYLLADVEKESDILPFRSKTYTLAVAWDDPPKLFAEKAFRPEAATRIAYGQAELYNGTSWDLFTQDWNVRLVPASILESGSPVSIGATAAASTEQYTAMALFPREVLRWINAH